MAAARAEYLKRYLSIEDEKPKKKKKKKTKAPVAKVSGLRIVDDDVDFDSLLPENLEEDLEDQAPTVAEVIDERPEHIKQLEQYRSSDKWKTMLNDSNDAKNSDSDASPPRKKRHDSDSDASPPRKKRHDSDSDASPPRTRKHDSDSDASPPRKRRQDTDSDASPPRKKIHKSDSDASPPRKNLQIRTTKKSSSSSKNGNNSSSKSRKHSDSDNSPPRKTDRRKCDDSDSSPVRRKYAGRSDSELQKNNKSSEKPRKKSRFEAAESPPPTNKKSDDKMKKTLAGAKAGLSSAKDMKAEMDALRAKEDKAFSQIDDEVLGKNAATVLRDKSGKRRNMEAERAEEAEESARKAKQAEKYVQWGRGLKQTEQKEMNVQDTMHEMTKPLARYKDDADLDEMLKNQDRDGDPMLAFMKKKKSKVTNAKKAVFPRYSGPTPPPNRFNMWPGYRWDGVDRSNGFEKSFYAKQAEKKANREQAYKWSIEDM